MEAGGEDPDPVTISAKDYKYLLDTIKELETLAKLTMERVISMEDNMLTHLQHTLDNPTFPGADDLVSDAKKSEFVELRKLEDITGTGPGRKYRGVIVHSMF